MTDPYRVLGVTPNATDDEVKEAYRAMAKKYHPDNYANSPLADMANEKMKEVNEAYDQIVQERKNARAGSTGGAYGGGSGNYNYNTQNNYSTYSSFNDVRNLINAGRIADAEQILDGVPQDRRNAEWHFLKGTVQYRKGWVDEAMKHFNAAVQMDPNNMEYRMAYNQVTQQRNGAFGGYNPQNGNMNNAGCNPCCTMLCADCCCHMMCSNGCR